VPEAPMHCMDGKTELIADPQNHEGSAWLYTNIERRTWWWLSAWILGYEPVRVRMYARIQD
jgi:hypothetical protein